MRTVLAAAAAGALIMGSAAGAMAAPSTKGKPTKEAYVKVQTVDIHRHSPINVESVDTARPLHLRVKIRETLANTPIGAVQVTLTEYMKKSEKVSSVVAPITYTTVPSDFGPVKYNKKGTEASFKGAVSVAALMALVPDNKTALMCISSVNVFDSNGVEITELKYSTQSDRRLAIGSKKPVRQCVKVVNPQTPPAL